MTIRELTFAFWVSTAKINSTKHDFYLEFVKKILEKSGCQPRKLAPQNVPISYPRIAKISFLKVAVVRLGNEMVLIDIYSLLSIMEPRISGTFVKWLTFLLDLPLSFDIESC